MNIQDTIIKIFYYPLIIINYNIYFLKLKNNNY